MIGQCADYYATGWKRDYNSARDEWRQLKTGVLGRGTKKEWSVLIEMIEFASELRSCECGTRIVIREKATSPPRRVGKKPRNGAEIARALKKENDDLRRKVALLECESQWKVEDPFKILSNPGGGQRAVEAFLER